MRGLLRWVWGQCDAFHLCHAHGRLTCERFANHTPPHRTGVLEYNESGAVWYGSSPTEPRGEPSECRFSDQTTDVKPSTERRPDPAKERRTPTTPPGPGEAYDGWMCFAYSGPLNLHELTAEEIDARDIVHGLERTNRCYGQTAAPISVLWHSLMVAELCRNADRPIIAEALFHDAAEAYVGDWIRPLYNAMGPGALALKTRIETSCFEAAGLTRSRTELSPAVREADDLMLRYELHAPWGFDGRVPWHEPPTPHETRRVKTATARLAVKGVRRTGIGPDGRLTGPTTGCRAAFLAEALRVVPETAPIHRSIVEAVNAEPGTPAHAGGPAGAPSPDGLPTPTSIPRAGYPCSIQGCAEERGWDAKELAWFSGRNAGKGPDGNAIDAVKPGWYCPECSGDGEHGGVPWKCDGPTLADYLEETERHSPAGSPG